MLGLDESDIAAVAWALRARCDRLPDAMPTIDRARPGPAGWAPLDVGQVLDAIDRAVCMAGWCTEGEDLLLAHLTGRLAEARTQLAGADGDEAVLLPLLVRLPPFASGLGRVEHWGGRVGEVRAATAAAEAARRAVLDDACAPVVAELLARLAHATLDDAARRAREGRLTVHDLLNQARRVLADDAEARAELRGCFQTLLVDELEDSDPLTLETAGWLAYALDGRGDLGSARPGALFVVGDPAEGASGVPRVEVDLGERVELRTNLRSVPGIVAFVNCVFGDLLACSPGHGPDEAIAHLPLVSVRNAHRVGEQVGGGVQLPLPGLRGPDDHARRLELPPVVVLGGPLEKPVGQVRRTAARDAAAAVRRAVVEGWPVSDPGAPGRPARPGRWRDVAVLVPARSALAPLEEAFDEAGVPYHLQGAALLWGSDDVRDVLSTLAAAADPSDALGVLAALRSPGLGFGDDDLVSWHHAGGCFDPLHSAPPGMEGHPVGRALAVLARLHEQRLWCEPSALVRLAMTELRSIELAFAHRHPRAHWPRLHWLAEQARAFDESPGGPLEDFLRWAELQGQADGRASGAGSWEEAGSLEEDDDAVRVMTVDCAKGLEFPIVVVAGLERDDLAAPRPGAVLWTDDQMPEVRAGAALESRGYRAAAEAQLALAHRRETCLLRVAMTRARDHLVLCLHHRAADGAPEPGPAARLTGICRAHPLLWRRVPSPDVGRGGGPDNGPSNRPDDRPDSRVQADLAALSRVFGVRHGAHSSATDDADDSADDDAEQARADTDRAAWVATLARFGVERTERLRRLRRLPVVTVQALLDTVPAPGRHEALALDGAVHAVLAAVGLDTGRDAADRDTSVVAREQAAIHGVPAPDDTVASMAEAALASEVVRWAAVRRHHKEVYVGVALDECAERGVGLPGEGSGLLEGLVDLVVEDDDGLVVVDYRTDPVADDAQVEALTARFEPTVAAYAAALEAVTGQAVVRCVLLFLATSPARGRVLEGEDLAARKTVAVAGAIDLAAASI